jgi:ParB family chromosome partitioning protein
MPPENPHDEIMRDTAEDVAGEIANHKPRSAFRCTAVRLPHIDTASPGSLRYVLTYKPNIDRLEESIRRHGLLTPLILRSVGGPERGEAGGQTGKAAGDANPPRFLIISGYKRLLALRRLGVESAAARVLPGESLGETEALHLSMECNRFGRGFGPVEAARGLKRLSDLAGLGPESLARRYAPILGLPPSEEVVEDYLRLADAKEEILDALMGGTISTGHALALARVAPSQQVSIYRRVLVPCKLNRKEFEEVLRHLGDLALKKDVPIGDVLRWPEIAKILEEEPGDARRRGTDLRFALKRLRYPRLSAVEQQFTRVLKAARLGEEVRLSPPRFFEGEFLDLAFRVRSPDDFERLAGILHRLRSEGRIESLFRILREPQPKETPPMEA